MRESLAQRFWLKVVKETPTFCWAWSGRKDKAGYGLISNNRAHRISYEIHKGEIPRGMFVCHRCDNPECCNPDHLFLGTAYDNNIDRAMKTRRVRAKWRNPMETLPQTIPASKELKYWRTYVAADAKTVTEALRIVDARKHEIVSRPNSGR
jgi:hypothetical protein